MVPRSVPLVDPVVENSNKSSFNQRFILCKVLSRGLRSDLVNPEFESQ